MLDRFKTSQLDDKKVSETKATVTDAESEVNATAKPNDDVNFADELRAGMSELLGSLQDNPEMQQEFEKLMKGLEDPEITQTRVGDAKTPASTSKQVPADKSDNFQDTIQKTVERMKSSGDSASAAATQAGEDDLLAKMLKEMENGGLPGMDGASEEGFNKMLLGMMEQLTTREILYEPMKELNDKYPAWLEKHSDITKPEDMTRYTQQQVLVKEIIARFDRKGYSDDNQQDKDYIVERMQKVRVCDICAGHC